MVAPARRAQLDPDLGLGAGKTPCRLSTVSDDTLSGLAARDGITPVAGDRVLVLAQTATEDNGPYVAAAGAWARTVDFATSEDVDQATVISVLEGTANEKTDWMLTTTGAITLGSTGLLFEIIGRAGNDPGAHAANHLPSGSDPIATAAAVGLDGNSANAEGNAESMARSNHTHEIDDSTGTNSTINAGDAAVDGTAAGFSKKDHQHAVATGGATVTLVPDAVAAEGASANLAREDHGHAIATAAGSQGIGGGNAEGTGNDFARANHDHAIRETGGQDLTVAAIADNQLVERSGTTLAGITSISTAQHGNQALGDGLDHALATGATAGFLSAADKVKLDASQTLGEIDAKESVLIRTQGNVTLSGEQTIDGVLTSGDRILVDQQSTGSEDGIYVTASGAWTRSADMATGVEARGVRVWVEDGTVDGQRLYSCTNLAGSDIVGTDGLTFALIGAGSPRGAGEGLNLNGNDIEIVPADGSIVTTATTVGVGVLQTDAMHGVRGGGTQHADVIAGGADGFMTGSDKTKLDGITALAAPNDTENVETVTTETITNSDTAMADTLNATPLDVTKVSLFLNGIRQREGAGNDFTISGTTITWLASSGTAVNQRTTDTLDAVYLS